MLLLLLIFVPIIGLFIILVETSFNPAPANSSSDLPSPPCTCAGGGSALTLYKDPQTEERGEMLIPASMGAEEQKNNNLPLRMLGGHKLIKLVALGASLVNLLISLLIFTIYDFSSNGFGFVQEYHQVSYFDFYLGLDGLSIYFVLLTTIIIPIALLSN